MHIKRLLNQNNPAQPGDVGQGIMRGSNTPWAQGPANFETGFDTAWSAVGEPGKDLCSFRRDTGDFGQEVITDARRAVPGQPLLLEK